MTQEKLPKALSSFLEKKGVHWVARWRDTYWFTPKENSMYKNGKDYLYAESPTPLLFDPSEKLEIYNPKTQEYAIVIFDEKHWICRHGSYDEKTYLRGLTEYVTIDYDDRNHIYCFNLAQYLKDKHSPEISLKANGWGDVELVVSGVKKNFDMFKEWRENQTSYWDDKKNKGKEFKFFTYNEVCSFTQELDREISKIPVGSKYSDMYDQILNGEMSKEDFLKEIVK